MSLTWFNSVESLQDLSTGSGVPGANLFELFSGPYPLVKDPIQIGEDAPRQDLELVNAKVFKVSMGSDEYVAVILCRIEDSKPHWSIYCTDKQIQGHYRQDGKNLAANLRKEAKVGDKVCNTLEASPWVGLVPEMSACGFFRMFERRGTICSHTQAVLNELPASDLEEMSVELEGWLSGEDSSVAEVAADVSPEEAAFFDAAFIQHVMLAGERGSGKTYLARQAAERFDAVYLEMQMHPSMEAWEFRAHDRAWGGEVFTVLGKLAEAVHHIQQGKRVILVMDEFLNLNPMYTTAINTPLSLTSDDTYIIETGRIIDQGDGIGTLETVEVPSDMLWVVATTNIGARYNLDQIPPSVRARFQIILMNTNAERTESILETVLTKYDMPLEMAGMFRAFIERVQQSVEENSLDEEATTRLAVSTIRSVSLKAKRDKKRITSLTGWVSAVKQQLLLEAAQIVNFENGPMDEEQFELYTILVNACFKARR